MDFGIEIRKNILLKAVIMEGLTSGFLSMLLGIKNPELTKSFGNTGAALSFSQKINLLIDVGALENLTRKKFQAFMEIRNQFMHNLEATSFTKCLQYIPDTARFLHKNYLLDLKKSEEENYSTIVESLGSEVLKLTTSIIDKLKEKIANDAKAGFYKESKDDLIKSIFDTKEELSKYIDDFCNKNKTVDSKELKSLNELFVKLIYANLKKRFQAKRETKNETGATEAIK